MHNSAKNMPSNRFMPANVAIFTQKKKKLTKINYRRRAEQARTRQRLRLFVFRTAMPRARSARACRCGAREARVEGG